MQIFSKEPVKAEVRYAWNHVWGHPEWTVSLTYHVKLLCFQWHESHTVGGPFFSKHEAKQLAKRLRERYCLFNNLYD